MDSTKKKSLLIIIVFTLILILPVSYALIKNYFLDPKTEVKQAIPAQSAQSK